MSITLSWIFLIEKITNTRKTEEKNTYDESVYVFLRVYVSHVISCWQKHLSKHLTTNQMGINSHTLFTKCKVELPLSNCMCIVLS